MIHIIGGGLAGSEAAWQAASRGVSVTLYEMRPERPTPVHHTDQLAELVCSNSFRADKIENAVGLLKAEMRRLDSLVMRAADATRVPAGSALAVDRVRFAQVITAALDDAPQVTIKRTEVPDLARAGDVREPVIVATGPLTSPSLSEAVSTLVGREHLYFYDAISPIVLADSIDEDIVFRASRWGRDSPAVALDDERPGVGCAVGAQGDGDYLNCPMTADEYRRFFQALVGAELATVHEIDRERFFEGCLPIEVMARRGEDTLRFGPMKPVGLVDPRTGRRPYAVVQLRQDTLAGDHFSLVGFQTQLKWGEQKRVLRLIPGLEHAEFVRFGMIHRNTYINGPAALCPTWQCTQDPSVLFAGQISGVEGYVESAASGLIAGLNAAALARGDLPQAPPRETAIGALGHYVSHANPSNYQPSNIAFGLIPVPEGAPRRRADRRRAVAEHALARIDEWRATLPPVSTAYAHAPALLS
ncbi:MAG: methylenetetrahydrofolate--tRNA-(uracil(54)-C(5))-methyltransferase (FADH(2)-oxidizing) TrmFO [Vicinamibacterales bacterium]|nr:methylenetetrahydrofolate--tRNA-(uracil(54)-C(5))-methyltransferase (FADH(2)-oxidizing) TrmFO [Vicinamibacterales bacterium]